MAKSILDIYFSMVVFVHVLKEMSESIPYLPVFKALNFHKTMIVGKLLDYGFLLLSYTMQWQVKILDIKHYFSIDY